MTVLEHWANLEQYPSVRRRQARLLLWFYMLSFCLIPSVLIYMLVSAEHGPQLQYHLGMLVSAVVLEVFGVLMLRQGRLHLSIQSINMTTLMWVTTSHVFFEHLTPALWALIFVGVLGFLVTSRWQAFWLMLGIIVSVVILRVRFDGVVDDELLRDELTRVAVSSILLTAMAYMKSRLHMQYNHKLARTADEINEARELAEMQKQRAIDNMTHAKQLNDAKTRFLGNMNHELRTPLNAILGYTELLIEELEDEPCEALQEDAERIQSASHHLLKLLDDVLDIQKIEQGQDQLLVTEFDVLDLCQDVVLAMTHTADMNHNILVLDVDDATENYVVNQDPTRVRQILFNYLSNAIKFTKEGEITVRLEMMQDQFRLQVEDNGQGMNASDVQAIKQEYVQAREQSVKEYGGTGLGLPLCYHLVEIMGGEMLIHSTLGKGTTVTVYLPREFTASEEEE